MPLRFELTQDRQSHLLHRAGQMRSIALALTILALALVIAGCGGSRDGAASSTGKIPTGGLTPENLLARFEEAASSEPGSKVEIDSSTDVRDSGLTSREVRWYYDFNEPGYVTIHVYWMPDDNKVMGVAADASVGYGGYGPDQPTADIIIAVLAECAAIPFEGADANQAKALIEGAQMGDDELKEVIAGVTVMFTSTTSDFGDDQPAVGALLEMTWPGSEAISDLPVGLVAPSL